MEELKQKGIGWKFRFFWKLNKWAAGIPKYWLSLAASITESSSRTLGVPMNKIKIIYRSLESEKFLMRTPLASGPVFKFIGVRILLDRREFNERHNWETMVSMLVADKNSAYP